MPKHAVSDELYAALNEEQDKFQDELDLVSARRSDASSLLKDYEKLLKGRIAMIRQQKKGKVGVQTQIPGTETSSGPHRHPDVDRLILATEGILTKLPKDGGKKPDRAQTLVSVAGKVSVESLVGTREDAIARHEARQKKVPDLEWLTEEPGTDVARVKGGAYAIVSAARGYTLRWKPDAGRERIIAKDVPSNEATAIAQRAEAERQADLLLKNAGDGELVKADTRGAAAARKKARR